MPWPMVHLAVSDRLFAGEATPALLLGCIAPDAIHMRGNISREEKGVAHFVRDQKLPDISLILEKCVEYGGRRSEMEWKHFVLGYFSHIYTDVRWTHTVYADFENRCRGEKNTIRSTYNSEASQLEFTLMSELENSDRLLAKLSGASSFEMSPFVTLAEVDQYRQSKLAWLSEPLNEPQQELQYFQTDRILHFIHDTVKEWNELTIRHELKW
ncbi:hypothetical protein [Paenibacillus cymbidii]|uniref:hypothetical protein n=1 Tax=Paenibacillus cymbidii TaxID=1639034 RepID=UPI00107FE300|nr:hypothetical protein [Paenibacillus cymbidii]